MNHLRMILTAAILASATTARVEADLIFDSWSLLTVVRDFTPPASESDASYFKNAQSPFSASHTASLPSGSYSTASYDIGWLMDEAHVDIEVGHKLEQLNGETVSEGRIYFTPSVDSLVTFSGNWQYAWPSAALGQTGFVMAVIDLAMEDPIAIEFEFGGNVGIGPPFGTISLSGSAFIPAGGQYMLHYSANVDHIDPTPPGTFGEASGEFHFTITPIPEPAAAISLILFAALRRRRA